MLDFVPMTTKIKFHNTHTHTHTHTHTYMVVSLFELGYGTSGYIFPFF